jgi:hypothetical protein
MMMAALLLAEGDGGAFEPQQGPRKILKQRLDNRGVSGDTEVVASL